MGPKMSELQKREVLIFIKGHPELVHIRSTQSVLPKEAEKLWRQFAEVVNEIPGAQKNWMQWRKVS